LLDAGRFFSVNTGIVLSLVINMLVGAYFVWVYPRSMRKHFRTGTIPPGFAVLLKVLPPFGVLLMLGSLLYLVLALAGAFRN
jgi:hypothetical protein